MGHNGGLKIKYGNTLLPWSTKMGCYNLQSLAFSRLHCLALSYTTSINGSSGPGKHHPFRCRYAFIQHVNSLGKHLHLSSPQSFFILFVEYCWPILFTSPSHQPTFNKNDKVQLAIKTLICLRLPFAARIYW